jgi:hypothetical protein
MEPVFCVLDDQYIEGGKHGDKLLVLLISYDYIVVIGSITMNCNTGQAFEQLSRFSGNQIQVHGYLIYGLRSQKNLNPKHSGV